MFHFMETCDNRCSHKIFGNKYNLYFKYTCTKILELIIERDYYGYEYKLGFKSCSGFDIMQSYFRLII